MLKNASAGCNVERKDKSDSMDMAALSARAYRAIRATLPPQRNVRGQYLPWLTETEANRLAALRRRGESYSDAIVRLASEAQD